MKALTNIKHSGGFIEAGEEVEGVDDDELQELIEAGAIEGEGPNEDVEEEEDEDEGDEVEL